MEYHYSDLLEPSQYETNGLCDELPVRKHVAEDLEEIGTFKAQEDWRGLVAPLLSHYKGGLGPKHSFMAVSLPECLPERFEIVSYANEFAFLHDDVTDILNQEEGDIENDQVLDAFREGARNGQINALRSGKRQMQAKIMNTMMALDRPRALSAMRAWAAFVEQGAGRQHHQRFQTLEEYLPYRTRDVGHMFWHALVTFGCALTIPEEEMDLCAELVLPAVIAASLTNDLFSYEKECEAAQAAGLPYVVNALWVLMSEHEISLEEARAMCRMRIKEEVAQYAHIVRETQSRNDLPHDVKRYIELMQYSVSGNVAVRGVSAISSGIRLIPVILGLTITQIVTGGVIWATGIHNPFLVLGPAIAAVGSGLFMLLDEQSSEGRWIGFQIVLGVGVGFCLTIPLMLSQVVVETKNVSTATPIIIFAQSMGSAFLLPTAQAVFHNELVKALHQFAPDVDPLVILAAGANSEAISSLPSASLGGIMQSYVRALRYTFAIGIPFAGTALFLSLFMPWFRYHSVANKPTANTALGQEEKGNTFESGKSGDDRKTAK